MAKRSNWRGCPDVDMKFYNEWADPDLIIKYDGKEYSFNYGDIEDALWSMFLEDNGISERDTYDERGNISDEYEDKFSEYCQGYAYDYMVDLIYSGYFDGIEDDEGGDWHTRYEACGSKNKKSSEKKKKMLNQGCGSKRSAKKEAYYDGLDDRFAFDLDDEFEIYVGSDLVTCYVVDSYVIGDGAGLSYTIAIPVGDKDHWQMNEWIERGLNEFFEGQTDGSDYMYMFDGDISKSTSYGTMLPADVDDYNTYLAKVDVVPYDNVGPYGDYGIDAGVLESRRTRRSVKRESTEEIDPGNIYDIAVKTLPKEDIDHHASDLYLRKTPESTALINKMKYRNSGLLSTFRDNIDGDIWYELPFCYGFERSAAEREAELDRSVKQLKSIYGKESKRAVKRNTGR